MIIPIPTPMIVGQPVPDWGREGAGVPVDLGVEVEMGVDVPVGVDVAVGVAVGVDVEQTQLVAEVQEEFRQKPDVAPEAIEQIRLVGQSAFTEQTVLHAGTGVAVGVGVDAVRANEREQVGASCAFGILDGTFGATGCCLS